MEQTNKNFYRCVSTGDTYAVETAWSGEIIGSCGPLPEDALRSLDSYDYTSAQNEWLTENNDKLILVG